MLGIEVACRGREPKLAALADEWWAEDGRLIEFVKPGVVDDGPEWRGAEVVVAAVVTNEPCLRVAGGLREVVFKAGVECVCVSGGASASMAQEGPN